MQRRYAVVVGARPNFVKAAALFAEAKKHPDVALTLIHTGQHFDAKMSDIFFRELKLPAPDLQLEVSGEFHTERIGRMFNALKHTLAEQKFDAVLVFGDVNSTLAAAIAAAKDGQRLFHIEAGLRSHDRRMPEEINRAVVDHLSDLLFTSEPSAQINLEREGIPSEQIHYVGNIMAETIELFRPQIEGSPILQTLGLSPRSYGVVTIHRQENTDDPRQLAQIFDILREVNKTLPLVVPLHPGTLTRIKTANLGAHLEGLRVIEPLGYYDFLKLMMESAGVITDSGGIQEETSHLGIACATLRDNTERPITLTLGSNKLFPLESFQSKEILAHLSRKDFKGGSIPLWGLGVAQRIFASL
ncbi:MAG TPA: UDP-N-acetylglucosamine 2-epimerase (non-hydrolyzing) [Candidatus Paceibacterota bacterium]|nr:UDP-N-acetylglucosamine 2-epimerase (non-hydrolyzing) [Candidatus Paceibacterota bacterium]